MSLLHLFEGFAGKLPEDVTFLGPPDADSDRAPPCISWKPRAAQHRRPNRLSGGPNDQGDIWLRDLLIVVRIWGEDVDQTTALLDIFVNIAELVLSGHSYSLGGEQWAQAGAPSNGAEVALSLILHVPIKRKKQRVVRITEITPVPLIDHG